MLVFKHVASSLITLCVRHSCCISEHLCSCVP